MFNRKFLINFLKHLGYFVAGFMLMLGFLNVMMWLFGKTVAIVSAWIIVILAWVGLITLGVTSEPKLTDEQVKDLAKTLNVAGV
jgi:cytochrome c biogenesis protein CcdA